MSPAQIDALPTLNSLREKALQIEEGRVKQETGVAEQNGLNLGSLSDLPLAGTAPASKRRKAEKSNKGGGSGKPARDAPLRESSPASKRSRTSGARFDGSDKGGGNLTDAEIRKALPNDGQLQKVAESLGKVPECFHHLDPNRMLAGEKLGRSLRAAV